MAAVEADRPAAAHVVSSGQEMSERRTCRDGRSFRTKQSGKSWAVHLLKRDDRRQDLLAFNEARKKKEDCRSHAKTSN